jgi:hypothetical protein
MVDANHGTDNNNSHHQLPRQLTTSSALDLSNQNWRYLATVGAIATDNAHATQNMILVRENIVVKQQDCLLDLRKATSHPNDMLSGKPMPH